MNYEVIILMDKKIPGFRQAFCILGVCSSLLGSCAKERTYSTGEAVSRSAIPFCRTLSDLAERDGEIVSFRCRRSYHPENHPVGFEDLIETYVDLADDAASGQTVLTSEHPIDCPGWMRVIGQVEVVDLSGVQYSRPWVRVHSFECEPQ